MKIFVTAIALVIAAPAAAQTAPAQQPHQGHGQHQQQGQGHGQHQPGQHQPGQQGGHQEHRGCCADRNNDGRMDCCERMANGEGRSCCEERPAQPAGHDSH